MSAGAETFAYTVGGSSNVVTGAGYGEAITNSTINWAYHDPAATNTALAPNNSATQRVPFIPGAGQAANVYVKVGYQFQANTGFIYYTTDGSQPAGAFGTPKGTTQVVPLYFVNHDSAQANIDWWQGTIPAQPAGTTVRYQAALFNNAINPISDADPSGAKWYGLNQAAITNFNPATATVWLHNDLNVNNTVTGLASGFHIIRARTFLPRPGQASVYNTFAQTFYYDGALPVGVVPYPANGTSLTATSYTVVVRADSTVTGVQFNIQDSNPDNDDTVTGQANGNGNDTNGAPIFVPATAVTPNPTITAAYTNLPQEFRFNYASIPGSGTATIFVRLNEFATSVYTNRYTLLTSVVDTLAPTQYVAIASPATNGVVLPYSTNTTYLLSACFSSTLTTAATNFNIRINGVLQPQSAYILRPNGPCTGMKAIYYNWNNPPPGTNVVQVSYTNAIPPLTDTRSLIVAPPLRISGLSSNNQLVVWASAPGVNYQVLATTNLAKPFQPISTVIPATGPSAYYYDSNPAPQKFYEIEMLP